MSAMVLLAIRDLDYPQDTCYKSAKAMIGDEKYRLVLGRLRLSLRDIVSVVLGTEHVKLDALRILASRANCNKD
jgi:hypothetical protein